jgi:hypothetical protein
MKLSTEEIITLSIIGGGVFIIWAIGSVANDVANVATAGANVINSAQNAETATVGNFVAGVNALTSAPATALEDLFQFFGFGGSATTPDPATVGGASGTW